MAFIASSAQLRSKIEQAMRGTTSCVFEPTCTFFSGNGYRKQWKSISSIAIAQDFVNSFGDVIQGVIPMQPSEIRDVVQNMQDLYCSLVLMPMDTRNMREATRSDIVIIEGRVLLAFKEDLDKKFGANAFSMSTTAGDTIQTADQAGVHYDITFYIIEEKTYQMRNTQMNAILRDATPESVLHWVSERLGVNAASISTPDNTQKYENMIIPPLKGAADIFPYLQNRYGLFAKGLGYYFSQGKMYIYPKGDQSLGTSPTDYVVHLINVPKDNYSGSNCYHNRNTADKTIYIASNTDVSLKSTGTEATENQGNLHVSLKADRIRDNLFTKETNGVVKRVADTLTSLFQQNTSSNMSADTQRVVYDGESSNPYTATSQMAEANTTLLTAGWIHALPRLLEPGQTMYFHYDGQNNEYKVQKGRLQKVVYQSRKESLGRSPMQPWITFNASMEIRLDPDFMSNNETQTING